MRTIPEDHDDNRLQNQAQLHNQAHMPQLKDENGDAVFGRAMGASVTDKQTYDQAMEAIWGGGGEATALEAKQFKDELFEKAAQRIFTDTSYRSIVHNLVHGAGAKTKESPSKFDKEVEKRTIGGAAYWAPPPKDFKGTRAQYQEWLAREAQEAQHAKDGTNPYGSLQEKAAGYYNATVDKDRELKADAKVHADVAKLYYGEG